jgi:chemotaxis protein methyltransferase CheR
MLLNSVEYFSTYIEQETGIAYSSVNLYQLQMRLEDICKSEKIESIDELAKKFLSNTADHRLKQKLIDTATNNETLFFRDPKFFSSLEIFLKEILAKSYTPEINIWSAASSTGQEAISMAITMEELSKKISIPPYRILATDICDKAIQKSKSGLYTEFEVMRGLSEERRHKYFKKEGDMWRVDPSIHSKIKFSYNNLIRSTVIDKFHVILCRNILIYQKVELKVVVLENLLKQLESTGALLLGAGETMIGLRDDVNIQTIDGISFYKKKNDFNKKIA